MDPNRYVNYKKIYHVSSVTDEKWDSPPCEKEKTYTKCMVLMYIMLWALGPLGPITLLVQHTYTYIALYLYRTLMPPI